MKQRTFKSDGQKVKTSGWLISQHACERWVERVGDVNSTWAARSRIQRAIQDSFQIPNRIACDMWVYEPEADRTKESRLAGIRYRLTGNKVFVTRGQRIITVMQASMDDLANLLIWQMLDCWLVEVPPAFDWQEQNQHDYLMRKRRKSS